MSLLCVLWVGCVQAPPNSTSRVFTGATMGTTYTVTVTAVETDRAAVQLQSAIQGALADVDRAMSTYDEQSELSRLNRSTTSGWIDVSVDLFRVLQHAVDIGERTAGAFDVTVGPLVDAWGFGPSPRSDTVLSEAQVATLLQRVGFSNVALDLDGPRVKKMRRDLRIDLSALAKGHGVDRVADVLERAGHDGYLIEVGGEIRARGRRTDGRPWRVGIENPAGTQSMFWRVVELRDKALATSGDYQNYFEADGRRYSHTIDPRSGYPITHGLASVSVVHDQCVIADALATALGVLGPDDGYEVAVSEGWAALFVVREDDGSLSERATPAFPQDTTEQRRSTQGGPVRG